MRVGFIGLGNMGFPMAANLIRAQLPVTVFDLRADSVAGLKRLGATPAASPAEVARDADVIGICVDRDDQVLSVVSGEAGLLESIQPGKVVILHSTIQPSTCREVDARCRERGVDVLEVTVSGFPDKATSGELTLMIGGSEAVMARCVPYLNAIGKDRFYVGPVGAGATAKLATSVMFLVAKLGVYEGLSVARANGIDADKMVEAALASSGYSEALRRWGADRSEHGASDGSFEGIDLPAARHLRDALAVAREHGYDLPVVATVLQLIDELRPVLNVCGQISSTPNR